jgi:glucokinase
MSDSRLFAGVDVGGSKVAVLITDDRLNEIARHSVPTAVGSPARAVERIGSAVDAALSTAGATRHALAAIGVGVPGRVDTRTGTVSLAVNLGWRRVELGCRLAQLMGTRVAVENDVRAAAAGLHARGVVGGHGSLAYLSIGTGISAGVVLDGVLRRGVRGLAGEIGHVIVDEDGPACHCGLRGCLEALASGPAIARQAEQALVAGEPSALADHRPITAMDLYRAAAEGDPLALRIARSAGSHVARAVHALVMTYDVEVVVLGGGVTRAGEVFLQPVVAGLDRLRVASHLAREVLTPSIVRLLPPDADPGVWGAVLLARDAMSAPKRPELLSSASRIRAGRVVPC